MNELRLTNEEVLYLETILGRYQESTEQGDLSKQILDKLDAITLE
jgi:hypothetical protein